MGYKQEAYDAKCAALARALETATRRPTTPERVTIFTGSETAIKRMASEEPGSDVPAPGKKHIVVLRRARPDIIVESGGTQRPKVSQTSSSRSSTSPNTLPSTSLRVLSLLPLRHLLRYIIPDADKESPTIQGVPRMEGTARNSMGRGFEGEREEEEPVQDPGLPCRWEMQQGGTRLPLYYGCGEAGPTRGRRGERGVGTESRERRERREREEGRAEAEELGAGEELPLSLPTPSFTPPTDEV